MRAEWLPAMAHRRILRNRGVLGIGWRHPLWWSPCHFRSNPIVGLVQRLPPGSWQRFAHVMMRPISAGTDAVQGELHRRYPTVPSHRCVTPEGWVEAPRRPSRPSAGSGYHVPRVMGPTRAEARAPRRLMGPGQRNPEVRDGPSLPWTATTLERRCPAPMSRRGNESNT